jgi:hypothetical protein
MQGMHELTLNSARIFTPTHGISGSSHLQACAGMITSMKRRVASFS